MDIKLENVFNDNLAEMIEYVNNYNLSACENITNSLTRTFHIVKSPRGVFISEFLEFLFDNLNIPEIRKRNEETKKIMEEMIKFLNVLKIYSIFEGKNDNKIMEKLIDIRYKVTNYQLKYMRTPGLRSI